MKILTVVRAAIATCAISICTFASATPILHVDSSGVLTGASGVNIGTDLYDVAFKRGSCNSVFDNCTQFAFNTLDDNALAANALLNQVFIDGPLGNFDSATDKIFGCSGGGFCEVLIPYGRDQSVALVTWIRKTSGTALDEIYNIRIIAGQDYTPSARVTFAVFTRTTPTVAVPEPSSIALMGLAFAGLAFSRRRKL